MREFDCHSLRITGNTNFKKKQDATELAYALASWLWN